VNRFVVEVVGAWHTACSTRRMGSRSSLYASAGLGASLMYFLDPIRGGRRRSRMRDLCFHLMHRTTHAAATTSRDLKHRWQGIVASLRNGGRFEDVDDDVLKERVRATMGHFVSHSHAIKVDASAGVVTLRGPIVEREAASLLSAIRRVRGVRHLIDALERHERGLHVPALQGGQFPAGRRFDVLRPRWGPATRVTVGAAGAVLAFAGARRHGLQASAMRVAGGGLLARAIANVPLGDLASLRWRHTAVDVQKTLTIEAPVGEVYAFWSLYERFPRFMSRVLDVTSNESRPMESHWKVVGPAGVPVEFDTVITQVVPNRLIEWRTIGGSAVAHTGTVRFDAEGARRTRTHVRISYTPPAGRIGHGVAAAFGVDPKSSMDEDMARMKTLIETGHAPRDAAQAIVPANPR
jgi:uncharacterized membrane protein